MFEETINSDVAVAARKAGGPRRRDANVELEARRAPAPAWKAPRLKDSHGARDRHLSRPRRRQWVKDVGEWAVERELLQTIDLDPQSIQLEEEEPAMSFTITGKKFYLRGNWASVNLRSNELNANVAVGFRLEPQPQTSEQSLEAQVRRRAEDVLRAAANSLAQDFPADDRLNQDDIAIATRTAAE